MLGVGFVPVPRLAICLESRQQRYQLEYGGDGIEIHEDAMGRHARGAGR